MRPRIVTWAVSVLCVGSAISACGGSSDNGVASKSPDAIVTAAMGAIDGAKSVHVAGSVVSGGSPITLDLDLLSGKGGRGEMSQSGLSFQLVEVGQAVYINGSPGFWRRYGGAAAAQLFQGKWLKAPAGSGNFASLSSLTNLHRLLTALLSSHGKLAKGATTTVNGQKVVAVNDSAKGGTLYVATTGKPYPVEILKTGPQGGHLVFDRFNESVSLTAPANSIDISQLQSK
ncbi:MAG: hypothetical protein WBP81_02850 [Solirubrobacteraceae bacterium]